MSFTDRENLLFEEWKMIRELPLFVKDGVIDESIWSRQSLRVLVLLPSVDPEECGNDLREHLRRNVLNGSFKGSHWEVLDHWLSGIFHLGGELPLEKAKEISENTDGRMLRRVAVMSINKGLERQTERFDPIFDYAMIDDRFIKHQFELYSPHIVIGCGNERYIWRFLFDELPRQWTKSRAGLEYTKCTKRDTWCFKHEHPSQITSATAMYDALMYTMHEAGGTLADITPIFRIYPGMRPQV